MKCCYVILHYKNIRDTEKCIESLLKNTASQSEIIVVDNGSGDNSGEQLKEKYSGKSKCHFLILPQNLGFSKGNNEGYKLAKTFEPDYIIVTNNDVVFYQEDFEQKIDQLYQENSFDVLGPDVYIPRHREHQNPLFKTGITIPQLEHEIAEYKNYLAKPKAFSKRLKIHAFKNMLCSHSKVIRGIYSKLRGKDNLNYKMQYENVGLQGSCLIFSKPFIEKEEKAFDPEPFLYEEEVFLYYRCKKKNYKTLYSPKIAIRHEEGASFNNRTGNKIQKLTFMLEHHVKAREELLAYLKSEVSE